MNPPLRTRAWSTYRYKSQLQFIVLTVSHVGRHRSGRLVWFWLLPYPPKHTLPFQLQVRSRPGCVTRSARAFRFVMHIACCRIFVLHYTVAFRCSLPVLYEHISLSLFLFSLLLLLTSVAFQNVILFSFLLKHLLRSCWICCVCVFFFRVSCHVNFNERCCPCQ